MNRLALFSLPLLAICAPAGDFWNTKAPQDWTAEEKQQILNSSPWAKRAQPRVTEKQARNRTGRVLWESRSGSPPPMAAMQSSTPTVRWESALPLRTVVPEDPLERSRQFYVISITGLPIEPQGKTQEEIKESLMEAAVLRVKGRNPVRPDDAELVIREGGGGVSTLIFYFPRIYSIQMTDKEVMFEFQTGPFQVESRFLPREMQFRGSFEL